MAACVMRRAFDEAEQSRVRQPVQSDDFGLFASPLPHKPTSSPLNDALLLVLQKLERRTFALARGDEPDATKQFAELKLAVADYHQLRAESDTRTHDAQVTAGRTHRWASLSELERRSQRERWQGALRPIVASMAAVAAGDGITASDVISRGITDGVLNGERSFLAQHPRVYSFVGRFLAQLEGEGLLQAKTVTTEQGGTVQVRRKSERAVSNANLGKVYCAVVLSV